MTDKKAIDIEKDGFFKMTLVALTANMAAAHVHQAMALDWNRIVYHAMEGTKELWAALLKERERVRASNSPD